MTSIGWEQAIIDRIHLYQECGVEIQKIMVSSEVFDDLFGVGMSANIPFGASDEIDCGFYRGHPLTVSLGLQSKGVRFLPELSF